jgi:hypothetical protein
VSTRAQCTIELRGRRSPRDARLAPAGQAAQLHHVRRGRAHMIIFSSNMNAWSVSVNKTNISNHSSEYELTSRKQSPKEAARIGAHG